jgi:hypothetical protein
MPTISEFYGINIIMRLNEKHGPHFHAEYAGQKAQISLRDGKVMSGKIRPNAYRLVLEWMALHHEELMENWERVQRGELPNKIPGLD